MPSSFRKASAASSPPDRRPSYSSAAPSGREPRSSDCATLAEEDRLAARTLCEEAEEGSLAMAVGFVPDELPLRALLGVATEGSPFLYSSASSFGAVLVCLCSVLADGCCCGVRVTSSRKDLTVTVGSASVLLRRDSVSGLVESKPAARLTFRLLSSSSKRSAIAAFRSKLSPLCMFAERGSGAAAAVVVALSAAGSELLTPKGPVSSFDQFKSPMRGECEGMLRLVERSKAVIMSSSDSLTASIE